MNKRVLIDQFVAPAPMQVVEGQSGGKLVVQGKVGQVDRPTANNRVYPRSVMEREIKRLQPRIESGSVLGAVDHPGDGKSRIRDAGCIVRGLWVERDGSVHGKFEVVEETRAGSDLAAFLRRGAAIGMSSRGIGSTTSGNNGWDVVGEDFRLNTWDFVADPACHDAYPSVISEDKDDEGKATGKLTLDPENLTATELREKFPELIRSIEEHAYLVAAETVCEDSETANTETEDDVRTRLRTEMHEELRQELEEDFSVKLVRALAEMRKDVKEEVRSEIDSDPDNASAKVTLKRVAEMINPFTPTPDVKKVLDEKDVQIHELRRALTRVESDSSKDERIDMLEAKGRELAMQIYVERKISSRSDADELREMIGDVTAYENADELKQKVESALTHADERAEQTMTAVEAQVDAVRHEMQEQIDRAEREAEKARAHERRLRESVGQQIAALEEKFTEKLSATSAAISEKDELLAEQAERLEEAVDAAERAHAIAYASKRTVGHPKRKAIMEAVESGELRTQDDIDAAANQLESQAYTTGGAHERVRAAMSLGRQHLTEEEREQFGVTDDDQEVGDAADEDLAALGTSLTEQTQLAGINRRNRR